MRRMLALAGASAIGGAVTFGTWVLVESYLGQGRWQDVVALPIGLTLGSLVPGWLRRARTPRAWAAAVLQAGLGVVILVAIVPLFILVAFVILTLLGVPVDN